eukprot:m.211127 g.211127  ORF g.211127 m.211127 type:complete len:65 (-) comp19023_c0_seq26:24-218(-)
MVLVVASFVLRLRCIADDGTMTLSQGFGTVAYLSLTVAFIQMLKAFTPVITLLVRVYLLTKTLL